MDEIVNAQQTRNGAGSFPAFGLGAQEALEYRKRFRGMIGVASKVPLKDRSVLSLFYTPGVAAPCLEIAKAPLSSFDYTMRGNTIALVSDGSSAFGLGNIGPLAALPMLEDACILFKTFGGVGHRQTAAGESHWHPVAGTGRLESCPGSHGGYCQLRRQEGDAGRCPGGRRYLHRRPCARGSNAGHGANDGIRCHCLCPGQPHTGDYARGGDGPLGLPQSGE